ncbi:MAG: hypothetical protein GF364_15530 [Candidatus Lokiarchaeota archaeon]|nr:hypothetical protein [Candidatus Lokiarchaeota archaeon]
MGKVLEYVEVKENWILKNENRDIEVHVSVPSTVFESLLKNDIIKNPFYGNREHDMSWVYDSDWTYTTTVELKNKGRLSDNNHKILRFHGLDTIADIYFNDILIGTTNNMFRSYDFNINSMIKTGKNKIEVKFKSPTRVAKERIDKYGYKLDTGPTALPGVPYLRKAQYSFGWDWGPKLPDIGIWKKVEIISYDDVYIESIYPKQDFNYNIDNFTEENIDKIHVEDVKLSLLIKLHDPNVLNSSQKEKEKPILQKDYTIHIELLSPSGKMIKKSVSIKGLKSIISFDVKDPELWWTHNLGKQNLYKLKAKITSKNSDQVLDDFEQYIGLREIKLIREMDKWGETFYFRLNGIPIFAKGANWIPVDSFIPRGKKLGLYELNLNYAKEANMNMIRVWGGGIYEDDLFYELCDDLGLLIWQDFPFACAAYPSHDDFINNVKQEAQENIKRLRHHPSLALWCGNNEIETYWVWYSRKVLCISARKALKDTYIYLFEELLPDLTSKFDPDRPYWPSSPSNGGMKQGGILKSNSPDVGDSHYWMVWHGGKPFTAYRKFDSRFMSEFGFESFPSMKTISEFCPENQYSFHSEIMENHQKNSAGNKKIMDYMKKRFSIPDTFQKQVVLSQITHAEAMEYGVEHWRRNKNQFHCMGALYWQLNDCWPVASWASIDYYGRWKALHYFAKRFYQNIFPSVCESKKSAELWVTNDNLSPFNGTLEWTIMNSSGKTLKKGTDVVKVLPNQSKKIRTLDLSKENRRRKNRRNNIIFYKLKKLKNIGVREKNTDKPISNIIYRGFRLFDHPKKFDLQDPNLEIKQVIEIETDPDDTYQKFQIDIYSSKIALYVYLESNNMDFIASDNFFSMQPNETRNIDIRVKKIKNIDDLSDKSVLTSVEVKKMIKVDSLFDLVN